MTEPRASRITPLGVLGWNDCRLLVESVADCAIFMLDPEGRVATWNLGAERINGYGADEILGVEVACLYSAEDVGAGRPASDLASARAEGSFEGEGWRVRKNGTRFWAHVVMTLLRDEEGGVRGYGNVTRDLTESRRAEETQRTLAHERAARAAAEEASRVKDEFLATVSHELRTPLTAILGWANLLKPEAPPGSSLAKGLDAIHRNARAQARIVEDLLDVSRIISGKLQLDLVPVNLGTVVREAIDVVRPSAAAKNIAISVEARSDVAFLIGDAGRLRQVAWNLFSNAVKFTDPGGRVGVAVSQSGSTIELVVEDTGRGIDRLFLPHVFQRFMQADGSSTRQFGGLGLGLAIVRHIVELHGGEVWAESEGLGRGARFRVSLPVRAVMPERQARPSNATGAHARGEPLRGLRVLVVDDDADARELLSELLGECGADVVCAGSAAAGLALVERFRPQVLISDIGMPDEDGYAFVRRVRALGDAGGGAVPSIALTAYASPRDRTRALAAGYTTHIGKPVNPDDLVATVANLAAFAR